jgi:hypothetical protein
MKCRYLISVFMFFFLISPKFIKAQENFPVSVKNGSITYEEVVSVSGNLTKNDLYLKTKQWVGQYFMVSPNYNPLQFEDMENGCIIVQIRLKRIYPDRTSTTGPWDVTCYGKIQVKNGKYKYTFSNFQYTNEDISEYNRQIKLDGFDWMVNPVNKLQKYERDILELIDNQMWKIISSLKATLTEPVIDGF